MASDKNHINFLPFFILSANVTRLVSDVFFRNVVFLTSVFQFNSHFTLQYHLLCVNSTLNFIATGALFQCLSVHIYKFVCLSTHSLNPNQHSTAYVSHIHQTGSKLDRVNKFNFRKTAKAQQTIMMLSLVWGECVCVCV